MKQSEEKILVKIKEAMEEVSCEKYGLLFVRYKTVKADSFFIERQEINVEMEFATAYSGIVVKIGYNVKPMIEFDMAKIAKNKEDEFSYQSIKTKVMIYLGQKIDVILKELGENKESHLNDGWNEELRKKIIMEKEKDEKIQQTLKKIKETE